MSFKEVLGNSTLVRDTNTKAILNTDQNSYEAYLNKRQALINKQEEVERLKSEMSDLKSDISQIKELLLQVLKDK